MTEVDVVNEVLETLGSKMRVVAGDPINPSIVELIRVIPEYIDKRIKELSHEDPEPSSVKER